MPIKIKNFDQTKLAKAIAYFPIVGYCFGLILAGLNFVLTTIFAPTAVDIILIVTLVIMDRGLHLDGLADTADGLFGGKNKEDILRIMKDSSVGAFGVTAIVLILLSQFAFLQSIKPAFKTTALIFMPTIGRFSVTLANYLFKPAKQEGLATTFTQYKTKSTIIATIFMTIITGALLYLQPKTWPIITAGFILMLILPLPLTRKINGTTGDIFGALIEINQVITLLLFALLK